MSFVVTVKHRAKRSLFNFLGRYEVGRRLMVTIEQDWNARVGRLERRVAELEGAQPQPLEVPHAQLVLLDAATKNNAALIVELEQRLADISARLATLEAAGEARGHTPEGTLNKPEGDRD